MDPPDPLVKEKRTPKTLMISGLAAFGGGWLVSVLHGLFGEVAGVDCTSGWWGFPSCTDTDDYQFIYIPVVGPLLEAGNHQGELSGVDQVLLGVETVFQLGGIASFAVGAALWPSKPDAKKSTAPVSLTVAPQVSQRMSGLALTGTF